MDRDTSTYLDCVRFLAAFTVLLGHVDLYLMGDLLQQTGHLAFEAVGVFFTLSGFVIGYVTDTKETTFKSYSVNRAARLYSAVIPCLALTFLLDAAGRFYFTESYAASGSNSREALRLLFSLTFLNESWLFAHPVTPGSNGAFWSLCYEVPYYFIFGTALFFRGLWRWLVPAAICCIAGPDIVMILPLWLAGVITYRICRDIRLSRRAGRAIFLAAALLWLGFETYLWRFKICASVSATQQAANLLLCAAGLIFAVSVIGFRSSGIRLQAIAPAARWLAGGSFTLYLLHLPFACLLGNALPAHWPTALRWSVLISATLVAAFAVAQVTERRKDSWRRWIEPLYAAAAKIFLKLNARRLRLRNQQV